MGLTLITPATAEPLSTGETKLFLKVDTTNDDAMIDGLIVAARQYAEAKQKRQLVSATWKLTGDQFPSSGTITLPLPPVSSVPLVEYVNTSGATKTFSSAAYTVDTASEPARIVLNPNSSWPSIKQIAGGVSVTFICGYAGPSSVPAATRQAMLLYIGHLYENRAGTSVSKLPISIDALLSTDSWGFYG